MAGVISLGDKEKTLNTFKKGMENAWDMITYNVRPGEVFAEDLGFRPGTPAYGVAAMLTEFAANWYADPLYLFGSFRRALKARKMLIVDPRDPTLKGTGFFRGMAVTNDPDGRLHLLADATVPGRWMKLAELKGPRVSYAEWVARLSLKPKLYHAAEAAAAGGGVPKRMLDFLYDWGRFRKIDELLAKGKKVPKEYLAEVEDVIKTAYGRPPASAAGRRFRRVVQEDIPLRNAEDLAGVKPWSREAAIDAARARRVEAATREGRIREVLLPAEEVAAARRALPHVGVEGRFAREALETRVARLQDAATEASRDLATTPEGFRLLGEVEPLTYDEVLGRGVFGRGRQLPGRVKDGELIPYGVQWAREFRKGIRASTWWRSRAASWLRPMFEMAPKNAVDIENMELPTLVERWVDALESPTRGSRKVMSVARKSELTAQIRRIQTMRGVTREVAFEKFFDDLVREGVEAVTGGLMPVDVVEDLLRVTSRGYRAARQETKRLFHTAKGQFGRGSQDVVDPVFETDLLNVLLLPDPDIMRRAIRTSFGTLEGLQKLAQKRFGSTVENLSTEQWSELIRHPNVARVIKRDIVDRGADAFQRAFLSVWKPMVLLRPSWTLRIVAIDENIRAFVMLQSVKDRLLSMTIPAKVAKRLGAQPRRVRVLLSSGKHADLEIGLPGLHPDLDQVNMASRREIMEHATAKERRLQGVVEQAHQKIQPSHPKHLTKWAEVLNHRVAQSALGRNVARMFLGLPDEAGKVWTRDSLVEWVRKDARMGALRQRGRGHPKSPEQVVDEAIAVLEYGTDRHPAILNRILDRTGSVDEALLRKTHPNRATRPDVVASMFDEAMMHRTRGQRLLDGLYTGFSRWPSNRINRQSLAKGLLAREKERLVRVATEGRVIKDADELALIADRAEAAAKEYAVSTTNRVMYSLTERNRFAEAHGFAVPFLQPSFEVLQVFSRLLWDSPQSIAHARHLFDLGMKSGAIYRDPDQDGALVYDATHWLLLGPLLDTVFGVMGKDNPAKDIPGFRLISRLDNLNLFLQNAFPVPIPGAGEVEIPTPGLNPLLMTAVEYFAKVLPRDFPMRQRVMHWAMNYGSGVNLLPRQWIMLLETMGSFVGWRDRYITSVTNNTLDLAARKGLRIGTEADKKAGRADYSLKDARNDARKFMPLRAVVSWLNAAPPMIEWPQQEARDQFFEWEEKYGWQKALDLLGDAYPDSPDIQILAQSHTMWTVGGLPLPANEFTEELMSKPEFWDLAKDWPELFVAVIPEEMREGKFDRQVYQRQVIAGLRDTRPARDRLNALEDSEGWEAYGEIMTWFRVQTEELDPTSQEYREFADLRDKKIRVLAEDNPRWGDEFSMVNRRVPFDDPELIQRLGRLQAFLDASPLFRQTKLGEALTRYFRMTDELEAEMDTHDIDSIYDDLAGDLGLTKRFTQGIAELKEFSSDFARLHGPWLGNHLRGVVREHEPFSNAEMNARRDYRLRRDAVMKRLYAALDTGDDIGAAKANIALLRLDHVAQAHEAKFGIHPDARRLEKMKPKEQTRELFSLSMRPYVFLSHAEKEFLGIKSNPRTTGLWERAARNRLKTVRLAAKNPDKAKDIWAAHEKYLEDLGEQDSAFKKELDRSHQWGYALERVVRRDTPWMRDNTPAAEAWGHFFKGLREYQGYIDREELNNYTDDYKDLRKAFEGWLQEWFEHAPRFKKQWIYLSTINRGNILDTLFPTLKGHYFPPEKE